MQVDLVGEARELGAELAVDGPMGTLRRRQLMHGPEHQAAIVLEALQLLEEALTGAERLTFARQIPVDRGLPMQMEDDPAVPRLALEPDACVLQAAALGVKPCVEAGIEQRLVGIGRQFVWKIEDAVLHATTVGSPGSGRTGPYASGVRLSLIARQQRRLSALASSSDRPLPTIQAAASVSSTTTA